MAGQHFRAGVVTVVRHPDGRILAFERVDLPGQWQLPQGGLHEGESPLDAAWRELREETGLGPEHVRLTGERDEWTVYEFPEEVRIGRRRGQVHRWFEFEALDGAIEPVPDGREFRAWRWVEPEWLIDAVAPFRRAAYEKMLR